MKKTRGQAMFSFVMGQAFGVLSTLLFFISYQIFDKKKLLIVQTFAAVSICVSFAFLGAISGFLLNIVCILRNIAYYFQKFGTKINYITTALVVLAMAVSCVFSWRVQGPVSLLITLALMINSVCLSFGNPQLLRKSVLISSPMAIIYNLLVLSFGGVLTESFIISASVIGIVRYNRAKKKEKEAV